MEQACTEHLKEIGGYLAPTFKKIEFDATDFEYEASVIIPVRNRIRTIKDAIRSVLNQKRISNSTSSSSTTTLLTVQQMRSVNLHPTTVSFTSCPNAMT